MSESVLFSSDRIIGVFRGFRDGGLEFHADLALPYRSEFQSIPMHGQFLLVQLESPEEGVLGRITSLSSEGKLAAGSGEEFNIRAVRDGRVVPDDLREQYLRYRVNIRVLGVIRSTDSGMSFVASHRRLPHVGSPVAFPSGDVLREIAGHNVSGSTLGHLALGEYFYGPTSLTTEPWMQVQPEEVRVNFSVESLVSRRSFIFARAGFGKSNLNKLLFSSLYQSTPTVAKRQGHRVPVGTLIFDPDGEYFWPDDRGRPGFCDVDGMENHLVVFTSRRNPSPFYESFVASGIQLDIRRLRPADVIAIALPAERQDQQNVLKLRALNQQSWENLVNLVHANGNSAPLDDFRDALRLEHSQDAEAIAARSNLTRIVNMLHDPSSQLMDLIVTALRDGKLCIVDVSQISRSQSLVLSGLILRRIFDRNQEEFTSAEPKTIPTIAVIEEAQAVLNERATSAEPYIQWVKEGRKYDLGAVMVTQQPGSIPNEILSQGDNWFLFHLLSAGDLSNVKAANAHFGQDILSTLLNEPIPGQGVFWSSVGGKEYPVPLRVLSFEAMHSIRDPEYNRKPEDTYARQLRDRLVRAVGPTPTDQTQQNMQSESDDTSQNSNINPAATVDTLSVLEMRATEAVRESAQFAKLEGSEGVPWGALNTVVQECLPNDLDGLKDVAYNLVPKVLNSLFGPQDQNWESYTPPGRTTTWVRRIIDR
ncbi:MAG: ATP-binding protein [Chloroflexi bacterium]|nr:ATP-binding protein [Chloroflexota bacterium]